MIKKTLTLLVSALCLCFSAKAADEIIYEEWFESTALRMDYIMGGDSAHQYIQLEQLYKEPMWAGRHTRLDETYLRGNGQINVFDHATGRLLFVHTFSTLFQEWQNELEATKMLRAFEASYLIPFPKKPVDVRVTLTDNHNRVSSTMTHFVDPKDILIRNNEGRETSPNKYIMHNGRPADCVDIAIVAEGYTEAEMDKFYSDCQRAVDAMFSHEPFKSMKSRFNVIAVGAESKESGPSVPHNKVWHDTALSSHYDTFYSDRYLTTSEVHHLFDLLTGIPFEHVIVLINSGLYGGGGIYNQWMCTTSDHPTFKQVLVHEFGHSYAGLADEYAYGNSHAIWYPADTEPWEPNITTLKDFDSKWKDLLPKGTKIPTTVNDENGRAIRPTDTESKAGTRKSLNELTQIVGVFEGAGYQTKGAYRPAQECRMKVNEVEDFCPVCTRAIVGITDFYTGSKMSSLTENQWNDVKSIETDYTSGTVSPQYYRKWSVSANEKSVKVVVGNATSTFLNRTIKINKNQFAAIVKRLRQQNPQLITNDVRPDRLPIGGSHQKFRINNSKGSMLNAAFGQGNFSKVVFAEGDETTAIFEVVPEAKKLLDQGMNRQ